LPARLPPSHASPRASPADQKTPPKAAAPRGEIHGVAVGGSIKFRASHCSLVNGSGRSSETFQLTLKNPSSLSD